jgi:hypothetical protein
LLRDLFDWPIALGTVHNIVSSAVEPARAISRRCDLAGVRIGAHDEIFQASHPVLVGVDTASTYCYLLSLEDHRDAVTWGVRLLELVDQGFHPDATIADAGTGLRAGQVLALPAVPAGATCSMSSVIWRRSGASWRTAPMEPWSTPNTAAASANPLADTTAAGVPSPSEVPPNS